MTEMAVQGGLIQMTAHMITRPEAMTAMWVGGLLFVAAVIGGACMGIAKRWKLLAVAAALALIGAGVCAYGANRPRVKEIISCASGPVSLEQVAGVYDIKDVDGKMITLWER